MADFDFDLFVIGGGSGGVRAARIASGHGARVALAEADRYPDRAVALAGWVTAAAAADPLILHPA